MSAPSSPRRKRIKEGNGMEFDQPRAINVTDFVEARALEITQLLAVVNNANLPAGEVAQGPRTFVQRLPRHMRRRAMSYNIKRLPRRMRKMAEATIQESKHRKKPPSRRWRRRPRNLLNEYARRQRKIHWLGTHIWHAKRFRMSELHGWRIPYSSYQRGFRASYRDAVRHCVIQDISFYVCFELEGPERSIVDRLNTMCHPRVSQTFSNSKVLTGSFEGTAILYEPGTYPSNCLGPIRFVYQPKEMDAENRILWIFAHPALESQLRIAFQQLFNLVQVDTDARNEKSNSKSFKNIDEFHQSKASSSTVFHAADEEETERVILRILKHDLVRFRLNGPKCGGVLSKVLHQPAFSLCSSTFKTGVISEASFQNQWSGWKGIYSKVDPGMVPAGVVLSLITLDPRLFTDYKKSLPEELNTDLCSPQDVSIPANSYIWSANIRRIILESKISDSELNDIRRTNISIASNSAPLIVENMNLIPILLIHQRGSSEERLGLGAGWDLVVPAGWAMPFWVALQYATAHAVGLEFQRRFSSETCDHVCSFPYLWPDTSGGRDLSKHEEEELTRRYLRRPENRRVKYDELKITHPFSSPWPDLTSGWIKLSGEDSTDGNGQFYVLRDRILLRRLDKSIKGQLDMDTLHAITIQHPRALVCVRICSIGKGLPKPRALVCIPTKGDVMKISSKKTLNEPEKLAESKPAVTMQRRERTPQEGGELECIRFNTGRDSEVEVDLNGLFEGKQERANQRKRKEKERKRAKRAAKRATRDNGPNGQGDSTVAKWENVVESCQRKIFGYVADGDYSLANGKGRAVAFCSLVGLQKYKEDMNEQKVSKDCYVLYRNVQSKYYRAARVSVLTP